MSSVSADVFELASSNRLSSTDVVVALTVRLVPFTVKLPVMVVLPSIVALPST